MTVKKYLLTQALESLVNTAALPATDEFRKALHINNGRKQRLFANDDQKTPPTAEQSYEARKKEEHDENNERLNKVGQLCLNLSSRIQSKRISTLKQLPDAMADTFEKFIKERTAAWSRNGKLETSTIDCQLAMEAIANAITKILTSQELEYSLKRISIGVSFADMAETLDIKSRYRETMEERTCWQYPQPSTSPATHTSHPLSSPTLTEVNAVEERDAGQSVA